MKKRRRLNLNLVHVRTMLRFYNSMYGIIHMYPHRQCVTKNGNELLYGC